MHCIIFRYILPALSKHQVVFIKVDQLCLCNRFLDTRIQVVVVYTDLSKTFDWIYHETLLQKFDIHKYFLHSLFLNWVIGDYLLIILNIIHGFFLLSGTPQGSILRSLFFDIYINDIYKSIVDNFLCVKDLKLLRSLSSDVDCEVLLNGIHAVSKWYWTNKCYWISINFKLCRFLGNYYNFFNYEIESKYFQIWLSIIM